MSAEHKPQSDPPLHDFIDMEAYDVVSGEHHRKLVEQLETSERDHHKLQRFYDAHRPFGREAQDSAATTDVLLGRDWKATARIIQGDLNDLQEQLETARDVLTRLRQWDVLNLASGSGDDGPYWRGEIDRALSNPASEPKEDA